MQYLGGKARTAAKITEYLETVREGRVIVEPFCGGLWITSALSGLRYATDISRCLINLYLALQKGWEPPETISEDEYNHLRSIQDPENPLTAFAGYGCSWGGKFFGGFARDPKSGRNYASNARNSLTRKMARCRDVIFDAGDYRLLDVEGALVYCDPPYLGTTGYVDAGTFNHSEFWQWCRVTSRRNTLIVSEYTAPKDFSVVLALPTKTDIGGTRYDRVEKLFRYSGC